MILRTIGSTLILALPLTMCCAPAEQLDERGYEMASAESATIVCTDPAMAEKIRAIMFSALDRALENHIVHTFEVWMKDDRDQPARAAVGVRNGINAYIHASKQTALWNPIVCPT